MELTDFFTNLKYNIYSFFTNNFKYNIFYFKNKIHDN